MIKDIIKILEEHSEDLEFNRGYPRDTHELDGLIVAVDFAIDSLKAVDESLNKTDEMEVKSCKDCERIEPLKGTWLPTDLDGFYTCSVCKGMSFPASKFCPNCGARMTLYI